jgi:hypothetical protein
VQDDLAGSRLDHRAAHGDRHVGELPAAGRRQRVGKREEVLPYRQALQRRRRRALADAEVVDAEPGPEGARSVAEAVVIAGRIAVDAERSLARLGRREAVEVELHVAFGPQAPRAREKRRGGERRSRDDQERGEGGKRDLAHRAANHV